MANATKLPDLAYFQWSRPSAPNPRLAAPIGTTDTTLTFTSAPLDKSGAVIAKAFILGVRNANSYVENIYVPAGALSADGLTATGCVRGIELEGLDFTVGDSNNKDSHEQDSPVFCNIAGVWGGIITSVLRGNSMATGGLYFNIGDETDNTITIRWAKNGSVVGWLRMNATTGKVQFQNFGGSWVNMDDVSASDLVKVSANDTTAGYLNGKLVAGTNTTLTENNDGLNETLQVNAAGPLASIVTDVTATAAEINAIAGGAGATVTSTNLETLTDGSNADALHNHAVFNPLSKVFAENVNGSVTPKALALGTENMVNQISYTYGDHVAGGAGTNFGNVDANTRIGQSFTPTSSIGTACEIIEVRVIMRRNGTPTGVVYCDIYSDSAGLPSTLLGTSDAVDPTTFTASDHQAVRFPFTTPVASTIGTKIHFVLRRSGANDAANYFIVATPTSAYASHVASLYTASSTSWAAIAGDVDLRFQVLYRLTGLEGKVFMADGDDVFRKNFIGFTKENKLATETGTIYPAGQTMDSFTGLDIGKMYYLTGTQGEIGSTPTVSTTLSLIPVGRSTSATEIFISNSPKRGKATTGLASSAVLPDNNTVYRIFIPTGYLPEKIKLALSNAAAGGFSQVFEFLGLGSPTVITSNSTLGASYVSNTGTSVHSSQTASIGSITVAQVYDTGFDLQLTLSATDTYYISDPIVEGN